MANAYELDEAIWTNKIVGHEDAVDPQTLLANPFNFRIHSKLQQDAVAGLLDEIGWVKSVVVNTVSGHIVDGHARVTLALRKDGQTVPVEYVELTVEQERMALAALDFTVGMAGIDGEKLGELLEGMKRPQDLAIAAVVKELALSGGLDAPFNMGALESDKEQASDGTLLTLVDISIDEPTHVVTPGQVWDIEGKHVLLCVDVMQDWKAWQVFLKDDALFVPYPGPFVPLSKRALETPLVMVQPDTYIAALLLDKYESVFGAGTCTLTGELSTQLRKHHND